MKLILLVIIMLTSMCLAQTVLKGKQCACQEMKNKTDCTTDSLCEWDLAAILCKPKLITPPQPPSKPTALQSKTLWCDYRSKSECLTKVGCAYVDNQCIVFPGCTPFALTTHQACQEISPKCTSDGKFCIDRNECKSYSKISCVKNELPDSVNNHCYWNEEKSFCENAETCTKLPKHLSTDQACRNYISYCTVNSQNAGCIPSALSCKEQKETSQCVWNSSQTTKCVWQGFCTDLTCENLLPSYKSIGECTMFLKECIPKKGGGCKVRGSCDTIDMIEACTADNQGNICHWHDDRCQDYTCDNASKSLKSHDECILYKSDCTVNKTKNGCINRICENASSDYTTTKQCGRYLEGCIAKAAGGCKTQTKCPSIELKEDCVVDNLNNKCIWNEQQTIKCNFHICETALGPIFNHQTCNDYLEGCIAKKDNSGCQDKLCTNELGKSLCTTDKNKKKCQFIQNCAAKVCSSADSTLKTYAECQSWNPKCTVNDTLNGCMDFPSTCDTYKIQEQCSKLKDGTICVWDGISKCFKKSCTTAFPIANYTTTNQCNMYITGCVVDNSGQGCINKITECTNSLKQDNCPSPCVWNAITKCQVKQCNNADSSKTTTTLCDGWISGCIVNATNNGCIDKPATCTGQTQQQCNIKSKSTGDCYYNGSVCVDLTCDNIATTVTTHSGCQTILNTCTLKANQQGCMTIPSSCSGLIEQQCYLKLGGSCNWSGGACRDLQCSYAASTTNFDTHDECAAFDKTCTVTTAPPQGCQDKLYPIPTTYANCIDAPQSDCSKSTNQLDCIWDTTNSKCVEKTCAMKTSPPYSKQDCFDWSSSCVFDSNPPCELYNVIGRSQKNISTNTRPCLIYSVANCSLKISCVANSITNRCIALTNKCEIFSVQTCNSSNYCSLFGTSCIYQTSERWNCSDYLTPTLCGQSTLNGYQCVWNGTECNFNPTCNQSSTTYCESTSYACTNSASGCVLKSANCSDYNLQEYCSATSTHQVCRWNGTSCENLNCSLAVNSSQSTCQLYHPLCFLLGISLEKCSKRDITCANILQQDQCQQPTNKGLNLCIWESGACKNRDCNTYTGTFNHTNCEGHNYKCTVDDPASSCMDKKGCSGYTVQDQCHSTNLDVSCYWTGSACVDRTCAHAPSTSSYDDDTKCKTWVPTCGVKTTPQGCVVRQASCSSITNQTQCFRNLADAKCYWDANTSKCVDDICTSYPGTSAFDSHSKCFAQNITCTVKATGQTTTQGCMDLSSNCNDYTAQDQCNFTNDKVPCIWNASITPRCQIKSCLTAPHTTSYDDHTKCSAYFKDANNKEICTVGPNGGCITRAGCSSYNEKSCVVDSEGKVCGWNGVKCDQKSCLTADTTVNTHQKCQDYLKVCLDLTDQDCAAFKKPCTVNINDNGCVTIPNQCDGMSEKQCIKDSNDEDCYWNPTTSKCQNFDCKLLEESTNLPDPVKTLVNQKFNYQQQCGYFQKCEFFQFKEDKECEEAQIGCTTDGLKCISRGDCEGAVKKACTIDMYGKKCYWSAGESKCIKFSSSCITAPSTIVTEKDCQTHLKGCTTKLGGGCRAISTCSQADVMEACNKDLNGQLCKWTGKECRNLECADFKGTTYQECQAVGNQLDCTSDGQGKCMITKKCSEITDYNNCYNGRDGPCIWLGQFNSSGNCQLFESCNSIKRTTHKECQQISKYCTTDSNTCVPIAKCSMNDPKNGCIIGTDGDCYLVKSVPSTCRLFTSCLEIQYLTHIECQQASLNCTSDGITGCIAVDQCDKYTQSESCKVSKEGIQYNNLNNIISTGKCVWGEKGCSAQQCSDLIGITHQECISQFKDCTSNGKTCMNMMMCDQYPFDQCNFTSGINGPCFLEGTQCRQKQCTDVTKDANQQICEQFSNCKFKSGKCVSLQNCNDITDPIDCYSNGLDGYCTWNQTQLNCRLMSECESASQDPRGCANNSDRCYWIIAEGEAAAKCSSHTCSSYFKQTGQCKAFINWENTQYSICALKDGLCTLTDPQKLSKFDCYSKSVASYTWNDILARCQQCEKAIPQNLVDGEKQDDSDGSVSKQDNILSLPYYLVVANIVGYLLLA